MLRRGFRRTPANHTMRLTWTFGNTVFVIRARTVMSWVSESHVLGHSHFERRKDRYPTRIYRLMITCIRLGAFPLLRDTFNLFSFSTYIISKLGHNVKSFLVLLNRCPMRIYRLMITIIRLGAFPLTRDTFIKTQYRVA